MEQRRFSGGDGEDELVDCEMEAAQALACLAHPVSINDEVGKVNSRGVKLEILRYFRSK